MHVPLNAHARPWRPGRASGLWKLDLKEGGFSVGAVHEDQAAFNCEERLYTGAQKPLTHSI